MAGYTKLFQSILASTIWSADDKTRLVWITLMAMANQYGIAEGSIPGLAVFARVSIEDCEHALNELLAPDPYSRSKEFEGRRIETVEGGWKLLNHRKYRDKMNADERREYLRQKQAEQRAKRKRVNKSVNTRQQMSTLSTHTEAEAEAEASRSRYLIDSDQLKDQDNQQQENAAAASVDGNGNGNGAKKKPAFAGQRLVIYDWQLAELEGWLGEYAPQFNLLDWFFRLDAHAELHKIIIPKRDGGAWLQKEFIAEVQRCGIPLELASAEQQPKMPNAAERRTLEMARRWGR